LAEVNGYWAGGYWGSGYWGGGYWGEYAPAQALLPLDRSILIALRDYLQLKVS
jgi:hypothetical protein